MKKVKKVRKTKRYEFVGHITRHCSFCGLIKYCQSLNDKLTKDSVLVCKDCLEAKVLEKRK